MAHPLVMQPLTEKLGIQMPHKITQKSFLGWREFNNR